MGFRLREQRTRLSLTLRVVASTAQISAAHLSDIENGHAHASLPVLLRISKALDLPLAQLLPRLGGRHLLKGSIGEAPGETTLSHPDLQLAVTNVNLEPEGQCLLTVEKDEDIFIFVFAGRCGVEVNGVGYELSTHDCLDAERATTIRITGIAASKLIICRGRRR
ncbi:MAG: helix-turn-helix domain-containing protein [bacterium]|nr:helix-turn-helix domain-containing protein [bacterium]MDE0500974.1 helix-turn-helix domain-containing protein [bacterium]